MNYWNTPLNQNYSALKSDPERGVTTVQAQNYIRKNGFNLPPNLKGTNPFIIFLRQFKNILIIILIFVAVFSFLSHEELNGTILLVMLLVNALMGFIQEYKAEKSLEKLRNLISFRSKVIRDGREIDIDSKMLIPGDIVLLNMGNIVPADLKIISAENLSVNEATLTGESLPVNKSDEDVQTDSTLPQQIKNGLFMGTSIVSGSVKAIVIQTGINTVLSKTVSTNSDGQVSTRFEKVLNQFSNMLLIFVIILTLFVFVSNVIMKRDIVESFLLGVTVALGITPEIMPIIISIAISSASLKLAKFGVLIRRLNALEDLGNVDIICTDKTGTITTGKLELHSYLNPEGQKDLKLLEYAAVCNANHPSAKSHLFPNPIDQEIWQEAQKLDLNPKLLNYKLTSCKDFNFETRLMQVEAVHNDNAISIIKGATESIVSQTAMSKSDQQKAIDQVFEYEKKGNRVISLAYKDTKTTHYTFAGYLLLRDKPKESFDKTVNLIRNLGVDLKVITGDSPIITREICSEAGLEIAEVEVITGAEIEKLNSEELQAIVETKRIFARVSPEQKSAIILALKANNHVVCYIGDGVNDIGAIRTADVGISVDSANDVTKDASDIVLLKKDLSVLADGIVEGRKTFDNTMKFVLNTMSSSFGNVLTIAIFSLFLKFMPFLPTQVLLIDSLSDVQHLTISTDNVDKAQLKKPQHWDIKLFVKFMLFFGVIGTLVDFIHVIIFQSLYSSPDYFRTVWFYESILTELLATFIIRTKLPFWKSKPSKPLILTSIVSIILGLLIPFTIIGGGAFSFVPIDLTAFSIIILLVLLYLIILETAKLTFYKYLNDGQ
jgi:Mg2+-importing ATPase